MTYIYADHNATTPLLPEVLETWQTFQSKTYGNPASLHRCGRRSKQAIEDARAQVAALIHAPPEYVHFTSGGTESNHWVMKGMPVTGPLYLGAIEHDSLRKPAESSAWNIFSLPVDSMGRYQEAILTAPVAGISVMWANNETGVLQDVPRIAARGRSLGAWVHTDAVQALGKVPVDFIQSGVHLMTLSAHKIGGPMGVGALVVDPSLPLMPWMDGGVDMRSSRAGTENLWGILGFGCAAVIAAERLLAYQAHTAALQSSFEAQLQQAIPECVIFCQEAARLTNTTCFGVAGIDASMWVMMLDKQGMAVSSGAACGMAVHTISHVLEAMQVDPVLASSAIRVSFGWSNTLEEVQQCVHILAQCVEKLQQGAW